MPGVVITGVGAVTAAGLGREALWTCVLGGLAPAGPRSFEPPAGLPPAAPIHAASIPEYQPREYLGSKGIRVLTPETRAFMIAAVLACRDAGLEVRHKDDASVGTVVGTTSAGLDSYGDLFTQRLTLGTEGVNPAQGPQTGPNTPAAQYSIFAGAAGPNLTLCTGTAAGTDAMSAAADLIRTGRAEVVLAGGVDTLSYLSVHAHRTVDDGFGSTTVARPFDRRRNGSVPGEAAVVLVMEQAVQARRRGARVLAEVLGAGSAFAPGAGAGTPDAANRAVRHALAAAALEPSEVAAVIASARGSRPLDAAEAAVLHDLFGEHASVCSVQGSLGECAGADGAIQTAVAVLSLHEGILPPTTGYSEADPALPALQVHARTTRPAGRTVLVHSLDPGGHAAALLLRGDQW